MSAAGAGKWPGQRVGLPAHGAGAVATWWPRLAALLLDWVFAVVLVAAYSAVAGQGVLDAAAAGDEAASPTTAAVSRLLTWFVLVTLVTGVSGASPGQHVLRLRVVRLDRRPVGIWRALIRTLLIALVLPAVVYDPDRRGLHDLAVGTVVVQGPTRAR